MVRRAGRSVTAEEARAACIAPGTRKTYSGYLGQIIKWTRENLPDPERYLDAEGMIDVVQFTPQLFESFVLSRFNSETNSIQESTLTGYRSAMKHVYRLRRLTPPKEYSKGGDLTATFSGLKNIEADELQDGSKRSSVKEALPYSEYQDLCVKTLSRSDGGFAHLFLTTQWNLMCRSVSAEAVNTSHLIYADDSIGCVLYKTKTNQGATGPKDPRHIYANPFRPATCWITALAIYLACNPTLPPGPLFPGKNQKKRFGKALDQLLGCTKTYGTHSIRKGVATFACSGTTGGPSIVSVCLRCGWSLGDVQDRYMRYEAAGDQYLGRVVAGLPVNKSEFAILPPHFRDPNDVEIGWCVSRMFPGMSRERELLPILRLCLACLVHHGEYLMATLDATHPLMATYLFRHDEIRAGMAQELVVGESPWMRATGIPPHVELYVQQEKMKASVDKLPSVLLEGIEQLLDERGARAGNVTKDVLECAIKNALLQVHITPVEPVAAQNQQSVSHEPKYRFWGGKFHILPENFDFPSIDAFGAWKLWWFGNKGQGYPPYCTIVSSDLSTRAKRKMFSEWSRVMKMIADRATATTGESPSRSMTEEQAVELFEAGFAALPSTEPRHTRRWSQLKVSTILKLVSEASHASDPNYHKQPHKTRKRKKTTQS